MAVECTASALAELSKCFVGLSPVQKQAAQAYLLCQIANGDAPPVGGGDLDWGPTPESTPGSVSLRDLISALGDLGGGEVNQLTFNTLETVGGDISSSGGLMESATFTALLSVVGKIEIKNTASILSLSFPALISTGGAVDLQGDTGMTTLNLNSLQTIGAEFNLFNDASLTALNLPALTSIVGAFDMSNCTALGLISAPVLTSVGGDILASGLNATVYDFSSLQTIGGAGNFDSNASLSTFSISSLQTVVGYFTCSGSTSLTALNLSALTTVGGNVSGSGCTTLVTVTVPLWLPTDGTAISFNNCALGATSVNQILARCVTAGVTTCSIDLSGGTNAAPTGQGIIDSAALTLAGNTVTTN